MRYVIVGGIAFVADSGVLALFRELVLTGGSSVELFFCTAAVFVGGLVLVWNYTGRKILVFK